MSEEKIHVVPLGEDWEIETAGGNSLSHEKTEAEALTAARELARERGVDSVVVHEGEGSEREIPVEEPKPAPASGATLPDRFDPEPVAQILHRGREQGF